MMKYIKIFLLVQPLLCLCFIFIYHKMTHMDSTDLEWVNNRYIGEIMSYKSQDGSLSKLTIKKKEVNNSLNPINLNYFASDEYLASAYFECEICSEKDTINGWFWIQKKQNSVPVYLSCHFGQRFAFDVYPEMESYDICESNIDDVVLFDDKNSCLNDSIQNNSISSFRWSKEYGLIQYCYKDGTVFNRINLTY